jgi:hypothetical protein
MHVTALTLLQYGSLKKSLTPLLGFSRICLDEFPGSVLIDGSPEGWSRKRGVVPSAWHSLVKDERIVRSVLSIRYDES